MIIKKRLLLTALLLTSTQLQFAETRTWTDNAGNSREAELVNAFGPVAYFKDPVNGYTPFRIGELIPEDQAFVESFKAGKIDHPWEKSKSEMTALLKDRLFTYKEGESINYNFGPEPEPDFYVLYYVGSGDEEEDAFTSTLVSYYDQLKINGFKNFEIILVFQGRSSGEQKKYMEEMGINWPAIKWISRKWVRELSAMKGKGDLHVIIVDQERHILQRTLEERENLKPPNLLLYLNNLITWTNPDHPMVIKYRFTKFLQGHLVANPGDSPPRPYLCNFEEIDFSDIPDRSFKIKLTVTEEGMAENAEITTEMPEETKAAILEITSGWMFIPRIKDGKYVKTTISFPVQNKQ